MSDEKKQDGEITIESLLVDEVKLTILLVLKGYTSLNLRQIARILGMRDPSAHKHVMELLNEKKIELDPSMAGKRGKYYKLSNEMEAFFDRDEEGDELHRDLDHTQKEYFEVIGRSVQTVTMLTQRFGVYAGKYMVNLSEKLANKVQKKEKIRFLSGFMNFVPIANEEQYEQFTNALDEFVSTVHEIGKENEGISNDELYERILVSSMAIPMKRIDPRELDLTKDWQ